MLKSFATLAALALATSAYASEINGEWLREDGATKIRFRPCGDAVCGAISWLKDPAAGGKVGEQVFFDMKANGDNSWYGRAYNPEDGKTYSGKMTLAGDKLTTSGCVFGGLICKSFVWTRPQ